MKKYKLMAKKKNWPLYHLLRPYTIVKESCVLFCFGDFFKKINKHSLVWDYSHNKEKAWKCEAEKT